jgi:predicted nucleic acid-binding protein
MIVVDTNVLSAFMQPGDNTAPIAWLDRNAGQRLYTTAVNIMEVRMGLELLPAGRRRHLLTAGFETVIETFFEDRILSLDAVSAESAAKLGAVLKRSGRTTGTADTQIAGIVLANNATLATRNIRDFEGLGLKLVNPWD